MARGVADVVEIVMLAASSHAFLGARRAGCWWSFQAGECVLERHHARVDEHERGIAERHKGSARHFGVIFRAEEIEKRAADFICRRHRRSS